MKEKCIRCGRETEYEVFTPVTVRTFFIEGSGQLCEECFSQLYGSSLPKPIKCFYAESLKHDSIEK